MWSLVLMLYFIDTSHVSGLGGGLATTTVDNFKSKVACEAAGQAFVEHVDVYQRNEVQTTGLFKRTAKTEKYRFYANNVSKAYQCMEIK